MASGPSPGEEGNPRVPCPALQPPSHALERCKANQATSHCCPHPLPRALPQNIPIPLGLPLPEVKEVCRFQLTTLPLDVFGV